MEIKNQDKMIKNFFSEYERLQKLYEKYSEPNFIVNLRNENIELD